MATRKYQPWTPSEEASLESWVTLHPELTWEEKADKYALDNRPARTAESLRSKLAQLEKGIRRHRPIRKQLSRLRGAAARQVCRQQQKAVSDHMPVRIPPPPVLTPKAGSSRKQAVLQRKPNFVSWNSCQHHPTYRLPVAGSSFPRPLDVALSRSSTMKDSLNCQSFKDVGKHRAFEETHGPERPLQQPFRFREPDEATARLWRLIYRVASQTQQ